MGAAVTEENRPSLKTSVCLSTCAVRVDMLASRDFNHEGRYKGTSASRLEEEVELTFDCKTQNNLHREDSLLQEEAKASMLISVTVSASSVLLVFLPCTLWAAACGLVA